MPGTLYICSTPIGNLGDMTPRCLDALRCADVVCAEDTRVTGKLLACFGIEKRLERLDEATISVQADRIVERIASGETIAFCSDAGMPGVSDPGSRLIDGCLDAGLAVVVLPGASAGVTAYVASGFSHPQFYFGGFFPRKDGERRETLESLRPLNAVILFYESPNRVASSLEVIAEVFPYRRVAVCRELTKVHEEVYRAMSGDVRDEFARRAKEGSIKGEIVLAIEPPTEAELQSAHEGAVEDAESLAKSLLEEGSLSKKEIVKELQKLLGISRNEAYEMVHTR